MFENVSFLLLSDLARRVSGPLEKLVFRLWNSLEKDGKKTISSITKASKVQGNEYQNQINTVAKFFIRLLLKIACISFLRQFAEFALTDPLTF